MAAGSHGLGEGGPQGDHLGAAAVEVAGCGSPLAGYASSMGVARKDAALLAEGYAPQRTELAEEARGPARLEEEAAGRGCPEVAEAVGSSAEAEAAWCGARRRGEVGARTAAATWQKLPLLEALPDRLTEVGARPPRRAS